MVLKIQVENSNIPVEFGEVNLSFSTSEENVQRLFELTKGKNEELESLRKQREQIEFNKEEITQEQFKEAVDNAKRTLNILYDSLFGEGTFDGLYAVYPSVVTLSDGFAQIMDNLPIAIEEKNKRLEKKQNDKLKKYRTKK